MNEWILMPKSDSARAKKSQDSQQNPGFDAGTQTTGWDLARIP